MDDASIIAASWATIDTAPGSGGGHDSDEIIIKAAWILFNLVKEDDPLN